MCDTSFYTQGLLLVGLGTIWDVRDRTWISHVQGQSSTVVTLAKELGVRSCHCLQPCQKSLGLAFQLWKYQRFSDLQWEGLVPHSSRASTVTFPPIPIGCLECS